MKSSEKEKVWIGTVLVLVSFLMTQGHEGKKLACVQYMDCMRP